MTSRIAQSPAACDVVIPLFSIGDFLSLLVISPDFFLDLAYAYSTFKYDTGRDTKLKKNAIVFKNVLHCYYKRKQRNVCYNFLQSLYSFAYFKCKGYILYSKLLLQWAVRKKISRVPNLEKLCLEIFKYHIEKKTCRLFSK